MVFTESSPSTPLIFVLSPGTDPAADLYKFAEVMQFSKKMSAISLGQGQVRACWPWRFGDPVFSFCVFCIYFKQYKQNPPFPAVLLL